jgi:hypothetical protein
MLSQLSGRMGLELNVHGLPKWMNKMNPDKMSSTDRHHIVSARLHLAELVQGNSNEGAGLIPTE